MLSRVLLGLKILILIFAVEMRNLQLKIISFQNYKQWYLIHSPSDKGFKGTIVNRALPSLHEGSLEIMLTVPLKNKPHLPSMVAPTLPLFL